MGGLGSGPFGSVPPVKVLVDLAPKLCWAAKAGGVLFRGPARVWEQGGRKHFPQSAGGHCPLLGLRLRSLSRFRARFMNFALTKSRADPRGFIGELLGFLPPLWAPYTYGSPPGFPMGLVRRSVGGPLPPSTQQFVLLGWISVT